MKLSSNLPGKDMASSDKRAYHAPVLQYFGAVTDLTNSAIGTCADDSDTNNCGGPNQNMEMRIA
jgi:hypothetical protein